MKKRTIRDVDVIGKRVLLRCDLNIPFKPGSTNISDDGRIQAVLPTIRYLRKRGARVILCSHLGRPAGKVLKELRLHPVASRLEALLGEAITYVRACVGPVVEEAAVELEPGQVLLLENLRFHPGEESNDPEFARSLASLAELYVNDAFGAAHRTHASIHAVTRYLPAVAGLQMEKELRMLGTALNDPARPLAAIIGGAKISDKIEVLQSLVHRVDRLFIGGGMAATFLRSQGHEIGRSQVEEDCLQVATEILSARDRRVTVVIPEDLVVANEFSVNASSQTVPVGRIPPEAHIMDIGPATVESFDRGLLGCRSVMWNGPMGVFEWEPFKAGTRGVAETVAGLNGAMTVVGGGSTAEAAEELGLTTSMTHVSMGGGASLEFLEGRELPGVITLPDKDD